MPAPFKKVHDFGSVRITVWQLPLRSDQAETNYDITLYHNGVSMLFSSLDDREATLAKLKELVGAAAAAYESIAEGGEQR